MRVLNVQLKHVHGGNPQVCLDYTRVLKYAGNEVVVLTNPADPFIEKFEGLGVRIIKSRRIGKYGSYDLMSILYFRKLIKDIKPDVIIVHEGRSAALLKRAVGSNVVVIDVNHGRSPKQSRRMDATIVTNRFQLQRNAKFLGDRHKLYYVRNSMNLEGHFPPMIPRERTYPPVIGTIGRFVHDKALDVFVDALGILDKRAVSFVARMAGEGEERDGLLKKVEQLGIADKVVMPGWVTNVDAFYSAIDIFCFPSRKEEFGLVLLEAYKYGLPAVVSDADGPLDIVEHGVDALMVGKENAEALADALQLLIEDKDYADRLAQAGYDKLIGQYVVPVVARQLQDVLEEVVSVCVGEKD